MEVDDNIINLASIANNVLKSRFDLKLPKAVKLNSRPDDNETKDPSNFGGKRKRAGENRNGDRVSNNSPDLN
jgi:hypothetical protein